MATIVNARDVLLQGSTRLVDVVLPSNIVPDAVREIILSPSTGVFKTNASGGTTTPTSITLTLTRKYVTGTATFSVIEGTATLTGTGDTRTLTFANMSSDRVVVMATVVFNSVTYTANSTIVKVKDGTAGTNGVNGTNGVDGRRGSVDLYVIGSSWSDTTANNAIFNNTGSFTKYAGDKVTIYNNAGFAQLKYWDGISAWTTGQIINGNVLVSGTVTSNAIGTNILNAVGVNTSQYVKAQGLVSNGSTQAAIWGENSSHNGVAVVGWTSSSTGLGGVYGYSTTGYGVYGTSSGNTGDSAGVRGEGLGINSTGVLGEGLGINSTGVRGYSTSGAAVFCDGKFKFGNYTYLSPDGSASKFMAANGTWKRPNLSDIDPTTGDTPGFQFSTDNGATWTNIRLRRI